MDTALGRRQLALAALLATVNYVYNAIARGYASFLTEIVFLPDVTTCLVEDRDLAALF